MQVTTIGLDIAKNVFQIHGINATEKVVVRMQVRRSQMLEFFKALPALALERRILVRVPRKREGEQPRNSQTFQGRKTCDDASF